MSSGGSDLQRPSGLGLAVYIGQIRTGCGVGLVKRRVGERGNNSPAGEMLHQLPHIVQRIYGQMGQHRCFGGVGGGQIQPADTLFLGRQGHGKHPLHRADLSVQGQFPYKGAVVGQGCQLAAGAQNPQQHRQIVNRAGFAHIRRGQIQGDAAYRKLKAQVFDGAAHPVPAFLHGAVGQAYQFKLGQSPGKVGFHRHAKSPQGKYTQTLYLCKHWPRFLSAAYGQIVSMIGRRIFLKSLLSLYCFKRIYTIVN